MRKESKKKKYTRSREQLLDDFHHVLEMPNLSPAFKFYALRKDIIREWTSIDDELSEVGRMRNPFWSEEAIKILDQNTQNGAKSERERLKGIQHDHIVPVLFFEEMIMDLVHKEKPIPKVALSFLFQRFARSAMVTAHENLKKIDCEPVLITSGKRKGETVWEKKPDQILGLPKAFFDPHHEGYLNPWARYQKDQMVICKMPSREVLHYDTFRFDPRSLTPEEQEGYAFWKKHFDQRYHV